MSLNDTIKEGVDAAFSAVGDLALSYTLKRTTGGSYDPSTGNFSGGSIEDTVRAVEGEFEQSELQSTAYQVGDVKIYLPSVDLANLIAVDGTESVHLGSQEWELVRHKSVPGRSLYELHIRKAS